MKKLIKVVIDRKEWSRGNLAENELKVCRDTAMSKIGDYSPRPKVGKMCCLGFASLVMGATARQISGLCFPGELTKLLPGLNKRKNDGDIVNTAFSRQAALINDNEYIDDPTREKKLKTLARKAGFDFQFIN